MIPNRVDITERPKVVDDRVRLVFSFNNIFTKSRFQAILSQKTEEDSYGQKNRTCATVFICGTKEQT